MSEQTAKQFFEGMGKKEVEQDSGDFLLCYQDISTEEFKKLLVDCFEQIEEFPGEDSAYLKSASAKVVRAMYDSLKNYMEKPR